MTNSLLVNLYEKILVAEKKKASLTYKENLDMYYLEGSTKIRALEALAKWSPYRNTEHSGEELTLVIKNLLTEETFEESITGLNENTLLEFGKTYTDLLARENETVYAWHVKGYDGEQIKTLHYKKDDFNYRATSGTQEWQGTVKAYTLTEATQLVMNMLSLTVEDYNTSLDIQVTNPYMDKVAVNK